MGAVRCPVLIGREAEVARGDAALAKARAGTGSVIAFIGEAGIGKTRLTKELAAAATRRGLRVISGRASLEFSAVPLRAWSEALIEANRTVAWPADYTQLAPYRAVLGLIVPSWRAKNWIAPVEAPVVLGEAILRTLEYLAGDDGLLVVLDDLHWADEQTLQSLSYLIDHIAEVPVVLCLALRAEGKGTRLIATLSRADLVESPLTRLTNEQVVQMIATCAADREADVNANSIVVNSEGLPLVVEDLLSAEVADSRPRRFVDLVRANLELLQGTHRRALMAAALLGERLNWRVVEHALKLEGRVGSAALNAGVSAGLVTLEGDRVAFRHALTRTVVASEILPREREELARSLAHALHAIETPSLDRDLLAADLLIAAGEPAAAVDVLTDAMRRAEGLGELGDALVASGRAFRHTRDHGLAALLQVGVGLVRLSLLVGQLADALEVGSELLARSEGTDRTVTLQLHLLLARARLDGGEWTSADNHLAAAHRLADDDAALAELAVLTAESAFGADRPGQRIAVEHQVEKALAMAERSRIDKVVCDAYQLAGRVRRLRDLNAAGAALEHALLVAERGALSVQRLRVLDELGTVEMLRDATTDRLERAYHESLRVGAFGAATSAGLNLASGYVMTGSHLRCSSLAADVQRTAARFGLRNLEAACEFHLGIAAAFRGQRDIAEAHCARAEQLAPNDGDLRAGVWAIAHGIGALIEDDRPRARRAFAISKSHAPERHARILDASLGPNMLLDAVDGLATSMEIRHALELETRGARWSELWLGAALSAALANEGDLSQASDQLLAALTAGERYPLFGAVVRRIIADTAIATGFTDPVELLRDAETTFVKLELPHAGENVRGLLRSLGHSAPRQRNADAAVDDDLRRLGVTSREGEVLSLLRDRLTNREIAARLFVSPKTVEKHVAALIVKLGASNRVELAEVARRRHPQPVQKHNG